MNRFQLRSVDKKIPADVRVLLAAISERSRMPVDYFRTAWFNTPEYLRTRKIREMREWIADFDAGKIVHDSEVESKSGEQ